LVQDAPISRIDLLICRNTLMYFESEAQAKILARLHYALNENGYLFLGKAEMLLSRDALFTPVELKTRVFTKVPKASLRERLLVEAGDVERRSGSGEAQYFDVEVVPLLDNDATLLGAGVTFMDVTGSNRLYRELERSKQELETASEELQSTNEELETTNEELQSTVEELETTNEELQSSNEELETMNEELESTNTELQTINTELQKRSIQ